MAEAEAVTDTAEFQEFADPDAVAQAAATAQAIAARFVQQNDPQFPVSSGAEHVETEGDDDNNNNKRKYEEDPEGQDVGDDGGPMRKRSSFNGPGTLEGEEPASDPPGEREAVPTDSNTGFSGPSDADASGNPGPGNTSEAIDVPAGIVGKLIGKAGETIKQLQYETGTHIQIEHDTPGDFKKVIIKGQTEDQVAQCKKRIDELINQPEVEESVECPHGIVGRVIGRGGETIKALQQSSQAHIVVNQDFPEGHPRKIIVTGKRDSVDRAIKMIVELINGEPGSTQSVIQKCIQYGVGITRETSCPKPMVGRVIGKGGETIKGLQKQFNTNIQINQGGDPCSITIQGTPKAVADCHKALETIISGAPYPPVGGHGGGQGSYQPPYQQQYTPQYPAGGGGYPGYPYGQAAAPAPAAYGYYGGGYSGYPQASAAGSYGGYSQYSQGGADPYAQSYGGYGQQAGQQAAAQPSSSSSGVWQEMQDDQGRPYYYNTQTGVSQWEKPADM